MAAVSVLVATLNPGSGLPDLVRSIDAQTLPAAEFDLVVVDASSDGSTVRLEQLAGRRPNVVVLTTDAQATGSTTEADRLGLALQRATAEYVLVVGQQQRLAPRALELLLDRARYTDADLVLGRVVTGTDSGSAVLPDDADLFDLFDLSGLDVAGGGVGVDLTGCLALVRRSLLVGRSDAEVGAALPALTGDAQTVSAVGRYACAMQDEDPSAPGDDVSLESPAYRWDEGMLQLTVAVRLPQPEPEPEPALRAWLVAAQGLAEIALPATIGPDERSGTTLIASAVLDPQTAEGGHPLEDGPWDLALRLAWPGREVTLPLTSGPARSAVVAGRPYVVRTVNRVLHLDAGATLSSVIGPVPTSRTSIAESVHGTLVTLDYPGLHVHGDAVLDARLLLDRFALPGRLVCRDGRARLEAHASSLAGTSTVRVVAGGGKPVATGLRLRVDGTGGMAFETVPAPQPAPKPTSPATPATGATPLVQRLRHRLPGAVDPLVHRLADVPVLRQAYRRLIRR
ncbi:glycosyltransferase family 2 protein [uncultured Amnibacterium sp.]|uniref:glycosyltransferase family 2 protein n=1 Tax=uncultured Amnibacterium sp. TaxID=1631851 RepID=UPI0035C94A7B